jgi:hypothetical protein
MEEEDRAMSKGPSVSATTKISEEPPKDTIITPLMQHIIDAHNPKVTSIRRQRTTSGSGGRTREMAREKENQKKASLPPIAEMAADQGKPSRADGKKIRERKSGKDTTGMACPPL